MAIEVSYSNAGRVVEVKASATVHGYELIEAHALFYPPYMLPTLKYVIIDKVDIKEYYVSLEEIKLIAQLDETEMIVNPKMCIVMIVPESDMLFIPEIWQGLLKQSGIVAKIFHTRADTKKWLAEQEGEVQLSY